MIYAPSGYLRAHRETRDTQIELRSARVMIYLSLSAVIGGSTCNEGMRLLSGLVIGGYLRGCAMNG